MQSSIASFVEYTSAKLSSRSSLHLSLKNISGSGCCNVMLESIAEIRYVLPALPSPRHRKERWALTFLSLRSEKKTSVGLGPSKQLYEPYNHSLPLVPPPYARPVAPT